MTKYSSEFRIEVVQAYLSGKHSYRYLASHYQIPSIRTIQDWVALARAHGLESLQRAKHKHAYSLEEKLAVVDYYQTHDEGVAKVAAHFAVNPSQVSVWSQIFNAAGAAGLRPRPKGRRSSMTQRKRQDDGDKLTSNEKDKLVQENMRLRKELYQTQMERDILKKLRAVSKNKQRPQKRQ
ncbi:helix-turn-helix domain-containing protein [Lacticaseibacillus zhaodongensis]|uniref:helix-turn-helix domain-containing protein n=1 Tax=Lacticaseibacillus zhaodongensis TaxID=2668065 RepID=UPI0012D2B921|nr:helix-turn-helix domain-containing protein [Lacticaseibacillus zhaodongensis]